MKEKAMSYACGVRVFGKTGAPVTHAVVTLSAEVITTLLQKVAIAKVAADLIPRFYAFEVFDEAVSFVDESRCFPAMKKILKAASLWHPCRRVFDLDVLEAHERGHRIGVACKMLVTEPFGVHWTSVAEDTGVEIATPTVSEAWLKKTLKGFEK